MSTLLVTVINSRLEATRVLPSTGLRFEVIGISTSAYISVDETVRQQPFVTIFLPSGILAIMVNNSNR